jgi:hypothetical protein
MFGEPPDLPWEKYRKKLVSKPNAIHFPLGKFCLNQELALCGFGVLLSARDTFGPFSILLEQLVREHVRHLHYDLDVLLLGPEITKLVDETTCQSRERGFRPASSNQALTGSERSA